MRFATRSRWSRESSITKSTISASSFCPPTTAGTSSRETQELNDVLVQAGQTLAERFNQQGGFLRSFVAEDSIFIDIMMNVGIIYYAARETGDRMLRDIATASRADDTRKVLVRGDGSTAHEGIFDLETGEFLRQTTQQGLPRRLLLVARACLGAVRIQHLLRIQPRSALPRNVASCADYYITHSSVGWSSAMGFQAPVGEPQASGHIRGRNRSLRVCCACAAWCRIR